MAKSGKAYEDTIRFIQGAQYFFGMLNGVDFEEPLTVIRRLAIGFVGRRTQTANNATSERPQPIILLNFNNKANAVAWASVRTYGRGQAGITLGSLSGDRF